MARGSVYLYCVDDLYLRPVNYEFFCLVNRKSLTGKVKMIIGGKFIGRMINSVEAHCECGDLDICV